MPANAATRIIRTALIVAGALLLTRLWFLTHRALDLDEYEHAHAAWSVARGLTPYRDFFEHHPPALYLLAAPLFANPAVASDAPAALRALLLARAAMWLLTLASFAIVYRIAARLRGRAAGAAAVVLLATSSQFVESMLEFRPDVPAVVCLLGSIWFLVTAAKQDSAESPALHFAAGVAFGAALLFTQKAVFAAPGLGAALFLRRRVIPAALFTAGAVVPIAVTLAGFAARGALRPLWYYTVTFNGHLNTDGFSPFPRLLSNVIQQPAVYVLGVIAIGRSALTPDARLKPSPYVVLAALSLIAGIFIIARAYDQYYALLLPLLAVLGGSIAAGWVDGARARRPLVAGAAIAALAVWSLAISARRFASIDPQFDDITFVTARTAPTDAYLGASPGAALFRPHAWYYIFLTGRFASDADYADLLRALEAGRLRPPLVVRDRLDEHMPLPIVAYIDAHYRHARGDLYLRQSEYGSASLNTSEASERFDRPFTR